MASKIREKFLATLDELVEFCDVNKRLPKRVDEANELRLYRFMIYHKSCLAIVKLISKYRVEIPFNRELTELRNFCLFHDRLPKSNNSSKIENRLNRFMKRNKDSKEVIEVINTFHILPPNNPLNP